MQAEPLAEARPLRVVLFGASGTIGKSVAKELLARGHSVTAVMRNPSKLGLLDARLRAVSADATDPLMVETIARGHDAVVSAIGPTQKEADALRHAAHAILHGARSAGVKRVVFVNGAGSLKVGRRMLMDTPAFPAEWRWIAQAHKEALDVMRAEGEGMDWTAVSPAAQFEPSGRTGKYRTGGDEFLADAAGRSRISVDDYAVALVDELERENHVGRRMAVAY